MNLTPRLILGDVELTDYPFAVEFGSDLGVAANVVKVIESGLLDGEIQRVSGSSNRTISVPVLLESSDLAGLADAEALLANECSKDVNEFRIDPGDGYGATTVFTVFRAQFSFQRDDELEQHGFRRYVIEMAALPFGQSEDEVVDVAVPFSGTPVTEVISDGTSTTGWSTTAPATVVTESGSLRVTSYQSSSTAAEFGMGYIRGTYYFTASKVLSPVVDFTPTQYITADLATEYTGPDFSAKVDGVELQQVSNVLLVQTETASTYRVTWRCLDTSASVLTINALGYVLLAEGQSPGGTPRLVIDNVQRSNQVPVPADTTGKQSLRSITVSGSARTAGSAVVEHETAGLGDVAFYTSSQLGVGYSPSMDRWFDPASASNSPDATAVSGRSIDLSPILGPDGADWVVPAGMLPRGPHLLMAHVKSTLGDTVDWAVSTMIGTTTFATQSGSVKIPAGTTYAILPMGVTTLPTTDVPEDGVAVARINLATAGGVTVGGLWSYFIGDGGDLTLVRAGSGTPSLGAVHNRMYLNAPSIQSEGRPSLLLGTDVNGTDAFHPGYPIVQSWGRHLMLPPTTLAHLVTTGAANAKLSLRHRPAWHTHAAS